MGWLVDKIKQRFHHEQEELVDPQAVALEVTLLDLRRVSSEIQNTNALLVKKLEERRLKGSK